MVTLPPWLAHIVTALTPNGRPEPSALVLRLPRDLALIAIGVMGHYHVPASLADSTIPTLITDLWALWIILGGILGGLGVLTANPKTENAGCWVSTGPFLIWAWTAVHQDDVTAVSWSLAVIFLAFVAWSQVARGLYVLERGRPKEPE